MVNSLWFKWKSLRLPWRRSFLVGSDLAGNTFWEFKDVANTNRFRRIVKFDPNTHHGDVQVSPQWHQWLRYVRQHPPSIEEQQHDLIRQAQIKKLARLADERWASKPSFLDKPQSQQPAPATQTNDATLNPSTNNSTRDTATSTVSGTETGPKSEQITPKANTVSAENTEDPWAKARSGSSEDWQPESWIPTSKR